jgi:DNA-binding MarR family transcriptional regulator
MPKRAPSLRALPQRAALIERATRDLRELIARAVVYNHYAATQLGLNPTDNQCMNLLELHGPMSPSRLARLAGLKPSAMTVVIDRLERAGFAFRAADPNDRRGLIITTNTERVRAEASRVYGQQAVRMERVWARFDENQLETIASFLRALGEEAETAEPVPPP